MLALGNMQSFLGRTPESLDKQGLFLVRKQSFLGRTPGMLALALAMALAKGTCWAIGFVAVVVVAVVAVVAFVACVACLAVVCCGCFRKETWLLQRCFCCCCCCKTLICDLICDLIYLIYDLIYDLICDLIYDLHEEHIVTFVALRDNVFYRRVTRQCVLGRRTRRSKANK